VVLVRALGYALCCFIGSTGQALCQVAAPSDSDAYRKFFSQVQVLVGRKLQIQEAIPLNDAEAATVSNISAEVRSQRTRLYDARSAVKQEALFRSIEDEGNSVKHHEWKEQQLRMIDDAEKKMIPLAVEKLKETLGDPRFQVLDGHVRSGTLASHIAKAIPYPKK
jgi:hypothetical protein